MQKKKETDILSLSKKIIYFYTFIHSFPEFSQAYAFNFAQWLCPILYSQKSHSAHSLDRAIWIIIIFFLIESPVKLTVMKGFFSWQGLAVNLEQKQASPTPSPLGLSCIVVFSTWLPVAAVTEHCVEVTTTALCALWVNKLSGVKDSCWNPHSGQKIKRKTLKHSTFHLSLI